MTVLGNASHALAAQITTSPVLAAFSAPEMTWTPSGDLQKLTSKIAFVLILVWVAAIAIQYFSPGRQRAKVGWGKFAVTGAFCVLLMDLTAIPRIVNGILAAFWGLLSLFGVVSS